MTSRNQRVLQVAQWLFIAAMFALAAWAWPQWAIWVMLLGMGVGVTWLVVYSYRIWRADPDKVAPPGT